MSRPVLTSRDRALLDALAQGQHLSTAQLQRLVFPATSLRRVQLRLRTLRLGLGTAGGRRVPLLVLHRIQSAAGTPLHIWSLAPAGQKLADERGDHVHADLRLGADRLEAVVRLNEAWLHLRAGRGPIGRWYLGAAARAALAANLRWPEDALRPGPAAVWLEERRAPWVVESLLPVGLEAASLKQRLARATALVRRNARLLAALPTARLALLVSTEAEASAVRGAISSGPGAGGPPPRVHVLRPEELGRAELPGGTEALPQQDELSPEVLAAFCREALATVKAARATIRRLDGDRSPSMPAYPAHAREVLAWLETPRRGSDAPARRDGGDPPGAR